MTIGITDYAGVETKHATIGLPDSTRLAGVDDNNACFEALKDETKWIEARLGGLQLVTIVPAYLDPVGDPTIITTHDAAYGTNDYGLAISLTPANNDFVIVDIGFQVANDVACDASAVEYEIAVNQGSGITAIPCARGRGMGVVGGHMQLKGLFQSNGTAISRIYIRAKSDGVTPNHQAYAYAPVMCLASIYRSNA